MKIIILNDIHTMLKQKAFYTALLVLFSVGLLTGFKFNISVGDELAVNAPYSVGFMIGLLSLTIILIATVLAFSLLFKEEDSNFSSIIFSTPIKKNEFAFARFSSFYLLTFIGFFVLVVGYGTGLYLQTEAKMNPGFNAWYFIYPLLIFGALNSLLVSSVLFFVSQKFKNKLLAAITGLMLYIFYMFALMYSNAPFMAQSLPQSLFVQRVSALVDLFGLSGYFYEANGLNILQRNNEVFPLSNFLLVNRVLFTLFSICVIYFGVRSFTLLPTFKRKSKKKNSSESKTFYKNIPFKTAESILNNSTKWNAVFSFSKIDTIYIFKSIPLVAVSVLILFYVGVEMFDDIDKGIRLPQLYASSGLLAQTINSSFYFIGALAVLYFVNDIFWRSSASGFLIIEDTTYYSREKLLGHIGSIVLLILYFTGLLLLEAIVFQILFNFPYFDWNAYLGVIIFNSFPLILLALFLLFINILNKTKTAALGISILFFLLFATPIVRSIFDNSIFRFLASYKGVYSDFLGYGPYLPTFLLRLAFGFSLIGVLFLFYYFIKFRTDRFKKLIGISIFIIIALFSSHIYLKGYFPKDKATDIAEKVRYEKKYRKYQNIPQPTIKKVTANIDLYPSEHKYQIQGNYILKNLNIKSIDSILISVPADFNIESLTYNYKDEIISIKKPVSELYLKEPIQPSDSALLSFKMSYSWIAVNGHDPFNAIVENGSFMRISRYFPQFGYDEEKEIPDEHLREKYELGNATGFRSLEAPKENCDDFIHLDMIISTPKNQIAVGTGELKKYWQDDERNFYNYSAEAIPFRFAVSSAAYNVESVQHNGIDIKVFHHPSHNYNVDHLINNTKLTLDYCTTNFGPYPFESVIYAEVSSFTEGFAGTSYPGVIFMTENMTFNARIEGVSDNDVVNELAGHEVSHFWWGNNQISPDYREGYAMLTESLAMYTEMMIYKRLHGEEKMRERVAIHQQIYDAEKGFYENTPLLKATKDHVYLAYSKGAIIFVELCKIIGEQKLNIGLKNFLLKHNYPNPKPISTDLLNELLEVADNKNHEKIISLFE